MSQHPNVIRIEKNRSHIIDMLTVQMHAPSDEVKRIFEAEFARLKSSARVLDYLEVLAIKGTRETLAKAH